MLRHITGRRKLGIILHIYSINFLEILQNIHSSLSQSLVRNTLRLGYLGSISLRSKRICCAWERLEMLSMMFVCLCCLLALTFYTPIEEGLPRHGKAETINTDTGLFRVLWLSWDSTPHWATYKGQTTVFTHAYLRLISIDENPGMSQWSSTTVTNYNSVVCPSNWLLVDQVNSSLWCRLQKALAHKHWKRYVPLVDLQNYIEGSSVPAVPWSSAQI